MNVRRFEFEGKPAPTDAATVRQAEIDAHAATRRAPDPKDEDQTGEESTEEPGYGHGV